jgi:NAD(P)-dependent dehydrogenase (short-subunit alcohol dehydrogenase family)
VNDLGASTDGTGSDVAPAADAVAEIVAAGGEAVADTNDVSSVSGAQALIDTVVERFGRLDILVNNARIFVAMTPGYVHPGCASSQAGSPPTIEDVADKWATINDATGYSVPADLPAWSSTFLAHLRPG